MITEKEIAFDDVLNTLSEKDAEIIQTYIDSLKDKINDLQSEYDNLEYEYDCLESENEDLENENSSLQNEIDEKDNDKRLKVVDLIQEIVDDQWKYTHPTYNTKEKILDRLDYILRYEV